MADVIRTIGSTGDYAGINEWVADLNDGAIYDPGDRAIGQLQDEIHTITAQQVIQNGNSVGGGGPLLEIVLEPVAGAEQNGVPGSGAVLRAGSGFSTNLLKLAGEAPMTIRDIEIDGNGENMRTGITCVRDLGHTQIIINRVMVHNAVGTQVRRGIENQTYGTDALPFTVNNCLVFNLEGTGSVDLYGIRGGGSTRTMYIDNCTVYDISQTGTASAQGIHFNAGDSDYRCRNNIAIDCETDFSVGSATASYNTSSDLTAPGANSNTSETAGDTFTNAGTNDFTLKGTSPAVTGTDLGTTNDVNIDITNRDRDAQGDDWSMGAFQYVVASGGGGRKSPFHGPFIGPFGGPIV